MPNHHHPSRVKNKRERERIDEKQSTTSSKASPTCFNEHIRKEDSASESIITNTKPKS